MTMKPSEDEVNMILARWEARTIYGKPAGATIFDKQKIEQMHTDLEKLLKIVRPHQVDNWNERKRGA